MHGYLLIDKPIGISSGDVVRIIKRITRPHKVGHTGTLDPMASGLLVILLGAATRTVDYLIESPKRYQLKIVLGEETDTCDSEGSITSSANPEHITLEDIQNVLPHFEGVIDQVPPHFSAIKKNGKPLYKLARKGVFPELQPRKIEIFGITLESWKNPILQIEIACSKGTYARSVARDIGRELGVGGRLDALRRTQSGSFSIDDAIPSSAIQEMGPVDLLSKVKNLDFGLSHIPSICLENAEVIRLSQGAPIRLSNIRMKKESAQTYKVSSISDNLLIFIQPEQDGSSVLLRPTCVLNL